MAFKAVLAAGVAIWACCGPASSAELALKPQRNAGGYESTRPHCGYRCGCLHVSVVRHRELAMTYSPRIDPRTFDEPRYYWGAVKTYPRYQTWYD